MTEDRDAALRVLVEQLVEQWQLGADVCRKQADMWARQGSAPSADIDRERGTATATELCASSLAALLEGTAPVSPPAEVCPVCGISATDAPALAAEMDAASERASTPEGQAEAQVIMRRLAATLLKRAGGTAPASPLQEPDGFEDWTPAFTVYLVRRKTWPMEVDTVFLSATDAERRAAILNANARPGHSGWHAVKYSHLKPPAVPAVAQDQEEHNAAPLSAGRDLSVAESNPGPDAANQEGTSVPTEAVTSLEAPPSSSRRGHPMRPLISEEEVYGEHLSVVDLVRFPGWFAITASRSLITKHFGPHWMFLLRRGVVCSYRNRSMLAFYIDQKLATLSEVERRPTRFSSRSPRHDGPGA